MMEELARIALVGTAKHPAANHLGAGPDADALVGCLPADDVEHAFLLRAGVQAVLAQCGRMPVEAAPTEPSPPEKKPFASPKIASLLQTALAANSRDLFVQFLACLDEAGLLLPPELLPAALDMNDSAVRAGLVPVLGERGRWLSRFNPAWRWAAEGTLRLSAHDASALRAHWEEGSSRERIAALESLRRGNPDEARQWLQESIDKEKADERLKLLDVLREGLSPADEEFLNTRLDDRSEQVRGLAARFLARLPGSALAGRMRERADALLSGERRGLLKKKFKLACTPPEEIEKSWQRDGIPPKPPAHRGKRAVWAETILSMTPPSHWCERFELAPAKLIEAIEEDDFAEAVLAGWTSAAIAFSAIDPASAAWLTPLWHYWLGVAGREKAQLHANIQEQLQLLLRAMPPAEAEAALLAALEGDAFARRSQPLGLLAALPQPWSEALADSYLAIVRRGLKRFDDRAMRLAETLSLAALALPRSQLEGDLVFVEETAAVATNSYQKQFVAREAAQFLETIRMRKAFYQSLASESACAAAKEAAPQK